MTLSNNYVTCGLTSRAKPEWSLNTSPATIGTMTSHRATSATCAYAIQVTSAASANVATLALSTGDCVQTTGLPVITGSGNDFQGLDLGASTKIHGIRLRASGSGTVTIGGSSSSLLPAIALQSGSDMVIKFPDSGATLSGATLAATFSASGGILQIEALTE